MFLGLIGNRELRFASSGGSATYAVRFRFRIGLGSSVHPIGLRFFGLWHPVSGFGISGVTGVFAVAASVVAVGAWVLIPGMLCCSDPKDCGDMLQRGKRS